MYCSVFFITWKCQCAASISLESLLLFSLEMLLLVKIIRLALFQACWHGNSSINLKAQSEERPLVHDCYLVVV